ncbi:MAG: alpha/beta fold hydrolase [Chloroflexota bacterium]|nr:alpha/beta fold hydrolase [Chloroflexota bacterium]
MRARSAGRRPALLCLALLAALLAFPVLPGPAAAAQDATPGTPAAQRRPADDADLFAYDAAADLGREEVGSETRGGVTVRDIVYEGGNGPVEAYLVEPAGEGPFAATIFHHWFDPASPVNNRSQFLDEAVDLAGLGVVSLLVQGTFPWAEDPEGAAHDRERVIAEVVELRRGLDLLLARDDIDPERVAFVGHDFGAMYGAILAAVDTRVSTAVLMAATPCWADWYLPFWLEPALDADEEAGYRETLADVDPIAFVGEAAPAPLLFQFAREDVYIPEATALAFYEAAGEGRRLELYDADHFLNDDARDARTFWLEVRLALGPGATGA